MQNIVLIKATKHRLSRINKWYLWFFQLNGVFLFILFPNNIRIDLNCNVLKKMSKNEQTIGLGVKPSIKELVLPSF